MQQTIIFENRAQERRPIDVLATIRRSVKSVNRWLDSKSEFYSRICEFSVTRRIVLRVNLITLCCLICAVAIENNPLVSITAMLCAGYLVYRLNKQEKGGEA
ncbi:MAG: Tat pathway signal protein [Prevotella sp.]